MTERTDVELVKIAAEKVMGWTWRVNSAWTDEGIGAWERDGAYEAGRHWNPLESIADAFMLVEKLRERGWWMRLFSPEQDYPEWQCRIYADGVSKIYNSTAATAPRAITLAAIAAVEAQPTQEKS